MPQKQEEWENQYPLNTFSGETKRELINFFLQKGQKIKEDERKKIRKEVQGIYNDVMVGKYGTKNRAELLQWLNQLKKKYEMGI